MNLDLTISAIDSDPNWIHESAPPAAFLKTGGRGAELFNFDISAWIDLDFEPPVLPTAGGGHPFSPLTSHQTSASVPSPPLSPPTAPELPSSSSTPPPLTPDLATVQRSLSVPPATHLPTTPTPPTTPPSYTLIKRFDFCPFTKHGQICQYVSWACSSNKQIKRHMKTEHFPDTSLGYECPNLKCNYKNVRFLRKDACVDHRRSCDLEQEPDYALLPHIVSGSNKEVDRWMKARCRQKRDIIKKLKEGTPWGTNLLQPVSI